MFPLKDTIQARNFPAITWLLILINALTFFYELSLPIEQAEELIQFLGMVPARIGLDPGSYPTFLTSMFLHGGLLHFGANAWSLYLFGDNVEDRVGPIKFLLFYLLCGLAAGLAHYAADPTSSVPAIGASGAIAGVMGAYFVLYPMARVITLVPILIFPLFLEIPAVVFLSIWFLTQLLSGTMTWGDMQIHGGVAWWAHVGGFVCGIVLLPLFKTPEKQYAQFHSDEYWPW